MAVPSPTDNSLAMKKSTVRVLLVDDQQEFLAAASAFLRLQPAVEVVGCFTSGRQAIEAVAELQPDLVLLDLVMPEMNGFEVTRRIKASGSDTRIVILSFCDTDGYRPAAVDAGAVGFINKMRFVDSFKSILDGLLSARP